MFEDFENRLGFWKNLGSNFTINYSGDAPSFMSDNELWESIGPNAGTKTLAEWEDGYVLTNNPDGTITANPKYTSGLAPETLVRVPVGPQSPTAMIPSTGGGVVVTGYGADTFRGEGILLQGWRRESAWTLKNINDLCPHDPDNTDEELCTSGPFTEFTIRGTQGYGKNEGRWWWVDNNELGLNHYTSDDRSGGASIVIRDGYQVKLKFTFETNTGNTRTAPFQTSWNNRDFGPDYEGVIEKTTTSTTVIMKGGDKLSVDIDQEWRSIANFYLSVQGAELMHITGDAVEVNDECYIELLGVWVPDATSTEDETDDDGTGASDYAPCYDIHRNTNTDGTCAAGCHTGFEFENGDCVAVQSTDDDPDDPNDCAGENRVKNADDTCGDCVSGYSEDDDSNCVADEEENGINWLLWGGVAAVAVFALMG